MRKCERIYGKWSIKNLLITRNLGLIKLLQEYVIRVSRNYDQKSLWEVKHRYNDFVSLNDDFKKRGVHSLPLPPKKLVGNKEREFLAKRMHDLQVALIKFTYPFLLF